MQKYQYFHTSSQVEHRHTLYGTRQWVVSLDKREAQKACAANVRVHKMHKCTHEWDRVCPWHSASVSDH